MKITEENVKIDAGLWQELTKEGANAGLTVIPKGTSMWPLIDGRKCQVIVMPVRDELLVGDIVLFKRADGQMVLHRIIKINKGKCSHVGNDAEKEQLKERDTCIQTCGDNCYNSDAVIKLSDVLGVAHTVKYKNGKEKSLRARDTHGAAQGVIFRTLNRPLRLIRKIIG